MIAITEMELTSMGVPISYSFKFSQLTACSKVSCCLLYGFTYIVNISRWLYFLGGAKFVSLNEKQRGFPTGLRVMGSQLHDYCLFEVKSSLEEARVKEGDWMQVQLMEVWGCGGVEAMETQQRIKQWETREILRRRKVY